MILNDFAQNILSKLNNIISNQSNQNTKLENINNNTNSIGTNASTAATQATAAATDTASIKSTLSTINTNASNASSYANSAKSNTATNNTASSTGTLSQKLSYIINNVDKIIGLLQNYQGTINPHTYTSYTTRIQSLNSALPKASSFKLTGQKNIRKFYVDLTGASYNNQESYVDITIYVDGVLKYSFSQLELSHYSKFYLANLNGTISFHESSDNLLYLNFSPNSTFQVNCTLGAPVSGSWNSSAINFYVEYDT